MSAYHGLACIGDERVPEPQPLPDFPVVCLELLSTAILNSTDLQISFLVNGNEIRDRIRIAGKIQLTAPGYSCHRGKLRNYIGTVNEDGQAIFTIQNYKSTSGLDLQEYQVHMRYFLIDAVSGHRSKEQSLSVRISI